VRRTLIAVVLSAVTSLVAAFGLSGCGSDNPPLATLSPPAPTGAAAPPAVALPAPEALTDVLYRLGDVSVPGAAKVGLIENTRPDDAATLDRFDRALADNGFIPLTFQADDIAWAAAGPGNVVATIGVTTPDPGKAFRFPMEFTPNGAGWQLTRATADQLLALGASATAAPTP
jgi:hypothetical protein